MDQDLLPEEGNLCRTSLSSIHSAAGRKPRAGRPAAIHLQLSRGAVRLPPAVGENGPHRRSRGFPRVDHVQLVLARTFPCMAARSTSRLTWREPH